MRIRVTEADICNGERLSSSGCPIALAVKRRLRRKIVSVSVGYADVVVGLRENPRAIYPLPADALEFANAFDDGKDVTPFDFDLKPARHVQPG